MNFPTKEILEAIDEAVLDEEARQPWRGHLGFSEIGEDDERTIWLSFRWCLPGIKQPNMARLLRLGDMIEVEMNRLLKLAGIEVYTVDPSTGNQFRMKDLGGHFAGSCDGVLGWDGKYYLLDHKSAKDANWEKYEKMGLKESPEYSAQAQCYMHHLRLEGAMYFFYNKDNSRLHIQTAEKDPIAYPALRTKAERIIASDRPPESSFPNRNYFKISPRAWKKGQEEYVALYWGDALPPAHCRSCQHSAPVIDSSQDAKWLCKLRGENLDIEQQRAGCHDHLYIEELVPAKVVERHPSENAIEYQDKNGERFFNGPETINAANVFSSRELAIILGPEGPGSVREYQEWGGDLLASLREDMGAKLIEFEKM